MHNFNDFKAVVGNLITLIREFNQLESEKLQAVQQNRVTFVEEAMKKEQVAIMKLRGLDKKREDIQKDLGWEGLTFQQILSQVTVVEKEELQPLFEQLSYNVTQFNDTRDSSQKALEISLHHINTAIAKRAAEESRAYTSDGNPRKPNQITKHLRNTKA